VASRRTMGTQVVGVEVEDSGLGIAPHLMAKIFDPFVTTKERGSGLGLSICRGIADTHRATIYALNSPKGRGAVIVVEFPALPYDTNYEADGVDERVIQRAAPARRVAEI